MDVKGGGNNSSANLVEDKEDSIVNYIAVKGSLHAYECAIFGLKPEEVRALESKFTRTIIVNGDAFKTNVIIVLNALVQLGYRIISSTGESEITWTMQREI